MAVGITGFISTGALDGNGPEGAVALPAAGAADDTAEGPALAGGATSDPAGEGPICEGGAPAAPPPHAAAMTAVPSSAHNVPCAHAGRDLAGPQAGAGRGFGPPSTGWLIERRWSSLAARE